MNQRLINADALIEMMYHEAFEKDSDMQRWDSGCWIRYKLFENCMDEQPTIEAIPVEWIERKASKILACAETVYDITYAKQLLRLIKQWRRENDNHKK